jgi:hypothetical protein
MSFASRDLSLKNLHSGKSYLRYPPIDGCASLKSVCLYLYLMACKYVILWNNIGLLLISLTLLLVCLPELLPFMIGEDMIIWTSIGLFSLFLTLLLVVLVAGALKPPEPSLQEILLQLQVTNPVRNVLYTDNVVRIKRSEPKKLTFWQKLFEAPTSRRPCFFRFCSPFLSTP